MTAVHLDELTVLEDLDEEECFRLLGTQRIGRVGLVVVGEAFVLPVNYVLVERSVVFRTALNSSFDRMVRGARVVFEIDSADPAYHTGWSVVGRGKAEGLEPYVPISDLLELPLRPWGLTVAPGWIRVPLDEVTGRRIVHVAVMGDREEADDHAVSVRA